MEILLAIVVAVAVIFFGALISIGNERQRRAIDGLREQVGLWAVQDLKIKREHLARTVQVPDPLGWLNKIISKACGYDLKLQVLEIFEEPQSLVCISSINNLRVILSPISPEEIRQIKSKRQNRLSQFTDQNPLLFISRKAITRELSVLNSGIFFDIESAEAWQNLTGKALQQTNSLWVYFLN